jgi:hypothetical protein
MEHALEIDHRTDAAGMPAGGTITGTGLAIEFQDGPIPRGPDGALPLEASNGAFVEDLLHAALSRLQWYQTECGGRFACHQNVLAIAGVEEALFQMRARTSERQERGVEGSHKV